MRKKQEHKNIYHYKGNINKLENVERFDDKIENIRIFLKNELKNKNLNIFIGSGCSTPSIPLMGKTIGNILKDEKNISIKKKINEYIELKNNEFEENNKFSIEYFNDIEGFLTWLGKGIDFEKNISVKNEYKEIYSSLKKQFIDTIPKFDNHEYKNSSTIENYNRFYNYIFENRKLEFPKLNVFTTNYDLFNEYSFEYNKFQYTTGFDTGLNQFFNINQFSYRLVDSKERYKDKWQPTTKEVNLYKLHGSINWIEKNNRLVQSVNDEKDENIIIYPTALKHEETRQSPYSELFRELSIQLQKPNSLLFIMGYGFGDEHINNIISQSLSNPDFTLIVFGDIGEVGLAKFDEENQSANFHIIGGETKNSDKKAHYFSEIVSQFCVNESIW